MAQHWLEQGAQRLHLVDLNGAVAGKPKNEIAIKAIVERVGDEMPIQLGGGIRDLDTIERYLDDGVTYVDHRHRGGEEPRASCTTRARVPRPRHRRARRAATARSRSTAGRR